MQTVAVRGASAAKKPIPANAVLSGSIMAGGKLYISGMTGRGPNGTPKNDIKAQTKFTLDRIKAELDRHGMTFGDIVDSVVWLRDARHFQDMNAVYRETVTPNPPARATLRMPAVAADVLVEIMMVASK
jgi:enamine deaminase RidA (YjgF/YER057c/UK114 family)